MTVSFAGIRDQKPDNPPRLSALSELPISSCTCDLQLDLSAFNALACKLIVSACVFAEGFQLIIVIDNVDNAPRAGGTLLTEKRTSA
jgi:hypothetical protein